MIFKIQEDEYPTEAKNVDSPLKPQSHSQPKMIHLHSIRRKAFVDARLMKVLKLENPLRRLGRHLSLAFMPYYINFYKIVVHEAIL